MSAPTPSSLGKPYCRRCGKPNEVIARPYSGPARFDQRTGKAITTPEYLLRCTSLRGLANLRESAVQFGRSFLGEFDDTSHTNEYVS
jgi:hypothetical protein